jgi:hypothetical protein
MRREVMFTLNADLKRVGNSPTSDCCGVQLLFSLGVGPWKCLIGSTGSAPVRSASKDYIVDLRRNYSSLQPLLLRFALQNKLPDLYPLSIDSERVSYLVEAVRSRFCAAAALTQKITNEPPVFD